MRFHCITVVSVSTLKEISWIMGKWEIQIVSGYFFLLTLWQKILSLVISLTPNLQKKYLCCAICDLLQFCWYLHVHAHSGNLKSQDIVVNFRIRYHFRIFTCELWKQVELKPFVFILYLPNKVQSPKPRVHSNWTRASLGVSELSDSQIYKHESKSSIKVLNNKHHNWHFKKIVEECTESALLKYLHETLVIPEA